MGRIKERGLGPSGCEGTGLQDTAHPPPWSEHLGHQEPGMPKAARLARPDSAVSSCAHCTPSIPELPRSSLLWTEAESLLWGG